MRLWGDGPELEIRVARVVRFAACRAFVESGLSLSDRWLDGGLLRRMGDSHRFECVVIKSASQTQDHHGFVLPKPPARLFGKEGTVIWVDWGVPARERPTYLVELSLDGRPVWARFLANALTFTGRFDDPLRWVSTRSEVSFDTEPGGREGCLRRPGTFWECFIFLRRPVAKISCATSTWRSGITGHTFSAPEDAAIDDERFVLESIEDMLRMGPIVKVNGPDSLNLK